MNKAEYEYFFQRLADRYEDTVYASEVEALYQAFKARFMDEVLRNLPSSLRFSREG